jgi:hypothetical protein
MNDLREIEDLLRDATRAKADTVEPAPDAWDRLTHRTRSDRHRHRGLWIGGASVVAAAALVGGVLMLNDDDANPRVEVPPVGEDPTAPDISVGLAEIPWNDPIEIRAENSEPIVVPHAGTWRFQMVLPAELQDRDIVFCGGFEAPDEGRLEQHLFDANFPLQPGMFRCNGNTEAWGPGSEPFLVDVFEADIRVLVGDPATSTYTPIASVVLAEEDPQPSLSFRDGDRPAWTRNETGIALTGAGFDPNEPVTFVRCVTADAGQPPAPDTCEPVLSATADDAARVAATVDVPAGALTDEGRQEHMVGFFAFQGDALSHVVWFDKFDQPSLDIDWPEEGEEGTDAKVTLIGLRPGEEARLDVCAGQGFECTATPVHSYDFVGTGSDDLTVTVPAAGFGPVGFWLYVNGDAVGGYGLTRVPGDLEQLPPGDLEVSPASVPGEGAQDFTVSGTGWTAEGPLFVLSCTAALPSPDAQCNEGVTVTPVDGVFTVELHGVGVGSEGIFINVTDSTGRQTGSVFVPGGNAG